jgi:NAD(P)H-quinone oxidoreductase subunit 5
MPLSRPHRCGATSAPASCSASSAAARGRDRLPAAATAYLAVVETMAAFFAPSLPGTAPGAVPAWLLGLVVLILAAGTLLPHLAPAGRWPDRLYAAALSAGQQQLHASPGAHPLQPLPVRHLPRPDAVRT